MDFDELPVLTGFKEADSHGCLRSVLLQQSLCLLVVVDRAERQVHGSEGNGTFDSMREASFGRKSWHQESRFASWSFCKTFLLLLSTKRDLKVAKMPRQLQHHERIKRFSLCSQLISTGGTETWRISSFSFLFFKN